MLAKPVVLPYAAREAAARHRISVPQSARCETFFAGGVPQDEEALRILSCTHPILRDGERYALGCIAGGAPAQRRQLKRHLVNLLRVTGLELPDSHQVLHPDVLMLSVPWPYRGELRAVLAKAAQTWQAPGTTTAVGSYTPSLLPETDDSAFVGSLPGDDVGSVDHSAFRHQLLEFGLTYDGAVKAAVRLLLAADVRTWRFPLHCTVLEARTRRGVSWSIEFQDVELLERAYVLLNPVLIEMARMGSRLRPGDAQAQEPGDEIETIMPSLSISTVGNTYQARVEMARLIKNLILTLDRLGIEEPEGATAEGA